MTQRQNNQILKVLRQKAEEERVAAADKAQLERELMKMESDAQIAVAAAAATAAATTNVANARALRQKKILGKKDDIRGEAPPEVKSISFCFAGFPQEEIVRIFYNRFKAINWYRL